MRLNIEFIETRMQRRGIRSRAELAEVCGITRQHFHQIVHAGSHRLQRTAFGTYWEIAATLDCDVEDLLVMETVSERSRRRPPPSNGKGPECTGTGPTSAGAGGS